MSKYLNEQCPVCKNIFVEDDDVVVCPECGTPHHRACYNELHRCANAAKHKDGFVFESAVAEEDIVAAAKKEREALINKEKKSTEEGEANVCHICGKPVEKGATMCIHCGAVLESAPLSNDYSNFSYDNTAVDKEIEGEPVSDIAAAVGTNATRFIPLFIKNKKFSWNWSAFIFGPYYFFYRKMYRQGAIAMIVSLASSFICQGFFAEKYAKYQELLQSSYYRELFVNPFSNQTLLMQFSQEPASKAVMPMFVILFVIALLIRIFCGLFADSIYRQHTLRTVKTVNKRLKDGDYFAPGPLFSGEKGEDLNQTQMKLLFLNRKGGVSIFAPIAVFFAIDLLTQLIS